jgi:hypothetical protein
VLPDAFKPVTDGARRRDIRREDGGQDAPELIGLPEPRLAVVRLTEELARPVAVAGLRRIARRVAPCAPCGGSGRRVGGRASGAASASRRLPAMLRICRVDKPNSAAIVASEAPCARRALIADFRFLPVGSRDFRF